MWVAGDARYDARYDANMRWLRRVGNGGHGILPYCMQNDRWLGTDARAGCCVDSVAGSFARAEERREESVPSGYTGFLCREAGKHMVELGGAASWQRICLGSRSGSWRQECGEIKSGQEVLCDDLLASE